MSTGRSCARVSPQAVKVGIVHQLYVALEELGADSERLSIIGSWYDTLNDAEILALLRRYNASMGATPIEMRQTSATSTPGAVALD
jgi:hypothetical protein